MIKVVFLDRQTIAGWVPLPNLGREFDYVEYESTKPQDVISRCQGAHAVLTNKVNIGEAELKELLDLKYIGVAATGVNIIDLDACRKRQVCVANAINYGSDSVAEHTMMLMLMLIRQVRSYQDALAENRWQESGQFCFFTQQMDELKGRRLGLIGTGEIAKQVAKRAQAFGMDAVFFSPSGRAPEPGLPLIELDELLKTSDMVSIHCPLTETTDGLIGADALASMRSSAFLLNCARGPIVQSGPLLSALQSNQIRGAALDVLPQEPPSIDDPLFRYALSAHNLIITPHVAWASREAMTRLGEQLIGNLKSFFAGEPVNNLAQ